MKRVLILGGYGNFGARIAEALVKDNISIIIAGRDLTKAQALLERLRLNYPNASVKFSRFDANKELAKQLKILTPTVVINTIGPFQHTDYSIAKTCIKHQIHYIDLADARDFVCGISTLDVDAKNNNVLIVSGASTVPGLSSAILNQYQHQFSIIDSLTYGITPGQKASRGLATTESILTYLGKPLKSCQNNPQIRYGWQDIYRQTYPELGKRWMANCDIPDLDLFPPHYSIQQIQFSAGMEHSILHLGMWLMSYLVRFGFPINLTKHAKWLLAFSHMFDYFGTANGGMHMIMQGKDKNGNPLVIKWFIIAKNNDGPQIPCVPAIILSKKIINNTLTIRGAMPCLGMITLDEYMHELTSFAVKQYVIKTENYLDKRGSSA